MLSYGADANKAALNNDFPNVEAGIPVAGAVQPTPTRTECRAGECRRGECRRGEGDCHGFKSYEDAENAANNYLATVGVQFKYSEMNWCCRMFTPLLVIVLVGALLFGSAYWIAQVVFSVMGLAQSADIIRAADNSPQGVNCVQDLTNWFIVFGSCFFFAFLLGLLHGHRRKREAEAEESLEAPPLRHCHRRHHRRHHGGGLKGLIHLFLMGWVIYGFTLANRQDGVYAACNPEFYAFFSLVVNFLFWGGIAMVAAIALVGLYVRSGMKKVPISEEKPSAWQGGMS